MAVAATYVSATSFTVSTDLTADFVVGVKVKAYCQGDGYKFCTVSSSSYASGTGLTTVVVTGDALTSNLNGVLHSNDVPASMPDHTHLGSSITTAVANATNAVSATSATTASACSGNSATATKLATARAINGVNFDGSSDITITAAPTAHTHGGSDITSAVANATNAVNATNATTASSCSGNAATATTASSCSGNAATATRLATARTINGQSFDGTANITITSTPSAHTHSGSDITSTVSNATNATYATSSGSAGSVNGYLIDQHLRTSDSPTFGNLTISGNANIPNGTLYSYGVQAYAVYTSNNNTWYSDARLKKNISGMGSVLPSINELRPVTYQWDTSNEVYKNATGTQLGLLAQEVELVFPDLVSTLPEAVNNTGIENTLTINYIGLIPALIKAVQELSAKNDELEARLATLENK